MILRWTLTLALTLTTLYSSHHVNCIVAEDPVPIVYPGQVNIGVIADLRVPGLNGTRCGALRPKAVRQALAAVWATHQVNFRKLPQEFNIGVYLYDSCGREDVLHRQMIRIIDRIGQLQPAPGCRDQRVSPVFGVIAQSDISPLTIPAQVLNSFSVPVVVSTIGTSAASKGTSSEPVPLPLPSNALNTTPSSDALSRAIISILKHLRWNNIVICASQGIQAHLATRFRMMAERIGLDVVNIEGDSEDPACQSVILAAWSVNSHNKVTLLFLDNMEAVETLRAAKPGDGKPPVVVVTPGDITHILASRTTKERLQKLDNVLMISPVVSHVPEFHAYFREVFRMNNGATNPLVAELLTQNIPAEDLAKLLAPGSDDDVSATIKAVWTLALAMKDVQKRMCRHGTDCLVQMKRSLSAEILQTARHARHVFKKSGIMSFEGTGLAYGDDGFLTTNRFTLKAPSAAGEIQEVAWYSDESGLILDELIVSGDRLRAKTAKEGSIQENEGQGRAAATENQPLEALPSSFSSSSLSMANADEPSDRNIDEVDDEDVPLVHADLTKGLSFYEEVTKVVVPDKRFSESWFAKPWGLVILSTCGCGILFTMYVTVFLMMKTCEGCVRKANNVMDFVQLLSLLGIFVGPIFFLFKATPTVCQLQRAFHNMAFAFCFSCILLKAMHLRSIKSIGLGGRESRLNQVLCLFFAVSVQLAMEIQWWRMTNPSTVTRNGVTTCANKTAEFLMSQIYIAILLILCAIVGFTSRNVPYTNREGQNLFISSVFCIPVFIAWSVAYGLVSDAEGRSVVASLGMTITGIAVLGGVYGPMLYLIHKFGRIPHKPLSYADSLSTVFTMFKDNPALDSLSSSPVLDTRRETTPRGRRSAKTLEGRLDPTMVTPAQDMVRNPLYVSTISAYP